MASKFLGVFILLSAALFSGVYLAGARVKKIAILPPSLEKQVALVTETLSSHAEPLPQIPTAEEESLNTTRAFAAELAKEIIKKNPEGPTDRNGTAAIQAIDPNLAVNMAIRDAQNISYETFKAQINLAELSIEENSPKTIEEYFSKLDQMLAESRVAMPVIYTKDPFTAFNGAATVLEDLVTALTSLPTPESMKELHREQIEMLATEKNIFRAIGETGTDPIKSLAAFYLLPTVFGDMRALEEKFIESKKTHGIE
jgi:hypothetical protein